MSEAIDQAAAVKAVALRAFAHFESWRFGSTAGDRSMGFALLQSELFALKQFGYAQNLTMASGLKIQQTFDAIRAAHRPRPEIDPTRVPTKKQVQEAHKWQKELADLLVKEFAPQLYETTEPAPQPTMPRVHAALEDKLSEVWQCFSDMLKAVEPDAQERKRFEEHFANRIDCIDTTDELVQLVKAIPSITEVALS